MYFQLHLLTNDEYRIQNHKIQENIAALQYFLQKIKRMVFVHFLFNRGVFLVNVVFVRGDFVVNSANESTCLEVIELAEHTPSTFNYLIDRFISKSIRIDLYRSHIIIRLLRIGTRSPL